MSAEAEFQTLAGKLKNTVEEVRSYTDLIKSGHYDARLTDLEQKAGRRGGGGMSHATKSWGEALVESEEFKALAGTSGQRGKVRVELKREGVEFKNLTSVSGSGGGLIAPDYRVADPVLLPRKTLTVRQLLMPGQTNSNMIFYVRQTMRTNSAATVAEGVLKPQSDMTFTSVQCPVTTVAHWMRVSRQLMDDGPALQSTVDGELRYGLADVEEQQLLFGDGTGVNLTGMIPQATAFSRLWTVAGETNVDTLLLAIAQAEQALLPATGIILNTIDWLKIRDIKDGQGRYLIGNPTGGDQPRNLWDLPIAASMNMPVGYFLVGSFMQNVQIFDRMETEVLLSSEDQDNFVKNMITIRAEERLALAVKRPQALIYGQFPN